MTHLSLLPSNEAFCIFLQPAIRKVPDAEKWAGLEETGKRLAHHYIPEIGKRLDLKAAIQKYNNAAHVRQEQSKETIHEKKL